MMMYVLPIRDVPLSVTLLLKVVIKEVCVTKGGLVDTTVVCLSLVLLLYIDVDEDM